MTKDGKFLKPIFYALTAVVGSFSLLLISLGAWLLFMITNGIASVVILAMLFGFGFGVYYIKDVCCRKWPINSRFFLLAAFLPSLIISASYLAQVAYRSYTAKHYGIFMYGLYVDIAWSFSISFFGVTALVLLFCVVFGAIVKKGTAKRRADK